MKMNDIVDITTLKQFCNYNSNKNWKVFTKDNSPLPHLVISHKKNASGSIQLVELHPSNDNKYWGGIKYLIFSYDSLVGVVCEDCDAIFLLNHNQCKTTNTTKRLLITIGKNSTLIEPSLLSNIREHFGLYGYYRLKDMEGKYI